MTTASSVRYADRQPWRTSLWRAAVTSSLLLARPASRLRALPDYLILGAQRAGTTSLHRYLVQSPNVFPPRFSKGVHWFDVGYHHDAGWYRAHYPLTATLRRRSQRLGSRAITGEASPYYLFHPAAPARIASELPSTTKLVVVLRDPVKRAWSHYHHEVARGFETLDFEAAIAAEPDRLAGEEERLLADPTAVSFEHQHHSYVARGRYAEQLSRLFEAVGRDRVLVLESGELHREPQQACERVATFLGIPPWQLEDTTTHNARRYQHLPGDVEARLAAAFAADNAALFRLLGERWDWTRPAFDTSDAAR